MHGQGKPQYRYDFFSVWSNGIPIIDEILGILREEPYIEIVNIKHHKIKSLKKFMYDYYGIDPVPVQHLHAKLAYLFRLKPEMINIVVRNFNAQEIPVGEGKYRKTQCQYIVNIKKRIRNEYNPKHADPEFHKPPLNKGVSHEHVVHSSDFEEQTDYCLKLLGYKKGISEFDGDDQGLLFEKPWHIQRPKTYSFKTLPMSSLKAKILYTNNLGRTKKAMVPLERTPHYGAFTTDTSLYGIYLHQYRFRYLGSDYTVENLLKMKSLTPAEIKRLPPILVKAINDYYLILDGIHRASLKFAKQEREIDCVVLT